jgi:hypothetical protein
VSTFEDSLGRPARLRHQQAAEGSDPSGPCCPRWRRLSARFAHTPVALPSLSGADQSDPSTPGQVTAGEKSKFGNKFPLFFCLHCCRFQFLDILRLTSPAHRVWGSCPEHGGESGASFCCGRLAPTVSQSTFAKAAESIEKPLRNIQNIVKNLACCFTLAPAPIRAWMHSGLFAAVHAKCKGDRPEKMSLNYWLICGVSLRTNCVKGVGDGSVFQ